MKNMEFLKKHSPLFTFGILIIAIVAFVSGAIKDVRTELKTEIKDTRGEIKDVRTELKAEIKDVRGEIKDVRGEIKDVWVELKAVRKELSARMGRIEDKLDLLIVQKQAKLVR